jgi:hypothetical protein
MLIAIAPAFSVLLGTAFLSEPLTRHVLISSGVAIGGCEIVALGGGSTVFSASSFVVLAAAVMQSVYHFVSKPLVRRYSGVEVATYAMATGTVLACRCFRRRRTPSPIHRRGCIGDVSRSPTLRRGIRHLGLRRGPAAPGRLHSCLVPGAAGRTHRLPRVVGRVHLPEMAGGIVIISGVVLINRRPPHGPREAHTPATTQHQADPAPGPAARLPQPVRPRSGP